MDRHFCADDAPSHFKCPKLKRLLTLLFRLAIDFPCAAVDTTGVASRRSIDMVLPYTNMALWCSKSSTRCVALVFLVLAELTLG